VNVVGELQEQLRHRAGSLRQHSFLVLNAMRGLSLFFTLGLGLGLEFYCPGFEILVLFTPVSLRQHDAMVVAISSPDGSNCQIGSPTGYDWHPEPDRHSGVV